MARDLEQTCERHLDRFDRPDALIRPAADGSHDVIVHDGGSSFIQIAYCAWCDATLDNPSIA